MTEAELFKSKDAGMSGNNRILTLSGLKSRDFSPLFSLLCSILISGDKNLISFSSISQQTITDVLDYIIDLLNYTCYNRKKTKNSIRGNINKLGEKKNVYSTYF